MKKYDPNNFVIDHVFDRLKKKFKKKEKKKKKDKPFEVPSETTGSEPINHDNECYTIII